MVTSVWTSISHHHVIITSSSRHHHSYSYWMMRPLTQFRPFLDLRTTASWSAASHYLFCRSPLPMPPHMPGPDCGIVTAIAALPDTDKRPIDLSADAVPAQTNGKRHRWALAPTAGQYSRSGWTSLCQPAGQRKPRS